ncbi:hypothetical protein [Mycoplasma sp. E35C]|uniref:hypothetical protein n=1 Tax=Mycoplasma sp. E35C TaxID=2801918 RepID=UPI001CA3DA3A|nr:hypothetical protein [Mycoplasma sp. E35C]QZX49479.1 hypothetical protein JJE79_01905 [Mycoplasma sp. E35C]
MKLSKKRFSFKVIALNLSGLFLIPTVLSACSNSKPDTNQITTFEQAKVITNQYFDNNKTLKPYADYFENKYKSQNPFSAISTLLGYSTFHSVVYFNDQNSGIRTNTINGETKDGKVVITINYTITNIQFFPVYLNQDNHLVAKIYSNFDISNFKSKKYSSLDELKSENSDWQSRTILKYTPKATGKGSERVLSILNREHYQISDLIDSELKNKIMDQSDLSTHKQNIIEQDYLVFNNVRL